MNIVFLDDDPYRTRTFRSHVPSCQTSETSQGVIKLIDAAPVDVLFLDHDLGGETYVDSGREDTGMEVVRWIVKHNPRIGHVVVHTLNDYAGRIMVSDLANAGYSVERVPFTAFQYDRITALCQPKVEV